MKYNFRKKKSQEKTKEDVELEKEIELLEKNMEAMQIASIPVPSVMAEKLATLKAKLNPNKFNAKKYVHNGIEYDSVREARFAKRLDEAGIEYKYQVEIELQAKFSLENENVQDICLIVDFVVDGFMMVDIKGFIQDTFKLKWKMLKNKYKGTREYFIIQKDSDIQGFMAYAKLKEWK